MKARTHAWTGVLAGAALSPTIGLSLEEAAVFTGACAGAALVPDLDMPRSTIGRALGPISYGLAWIVNKVSGGHRAGTHSLVGIALAAAAAWGAQQVEGAAAFLLVWLLFALAIRGSTKTAWTLLRTAATALAAVVAVSAGWVEALPWAVAVGAAAHVAGDCLTDRGCPLLWPYQARYGLPLMTTGGWVEPLVRWGCIGATVALVVT